MPYPTPSITLPQHRFLKCAGLEIHYTEWGARDAPVVVLWHGLTRTGRDFDELASALSSDYRVLCPDTPGRGLSQWSSRPQKEYTIPFYAQLALNLLDQLQIAQCHWVGTSMGGLLGMVLAATAPDRIQKLVLNDVGPAIPLAALERIRAYIAVQPEFASLQALEQWLRQVYVPFGDNTDAFWQRMTRTSARRKDNGAITLHYDPALAIPFQHIDPHLTLWQLWAQLACPMLVLRGANSDVLLAADAERMVRDNPKAQLVTLPNIGHAPTLANPAHIAWVSGFLQV